MSLPLTPVQVRVLGCLIEKQRTTPETYPLTINALRMACNQSTNRDPVVDYDEATVREAASALTRRRLARLASGQGSRATKYRQVANEALGLDEAALTLMAVLMLRGPQTPGELKARADRLRPFEGLGAVQAVLEELIGRGLVARLPRRPGQKEERYAQLLDEGGDAASEGPDAAAVPEDASAVPEDASAVPADAAAVPEDASAAVAGPAPAAPPTDVPAGEPAGGAPDLDQRLADLEAEVRELREALMALRRELGESGA